MSRFDKAASHRAFLRRRKRGAISEKWVGEYLRHACDAVIEYPTQGDARTFDERHEHSDGGVDIRADGIVIDVKQRGDVAFTTPSTWPYPHVFCKDADADGRHPIKAEWFVLTNVDVPDHGPKPAALCVHATKANRKSWYIVKDVMSPAGRRGPVLCAPRHQLQRIDALVAWLIDRRQKSLFDDLPIEPARPDPTRFLDWE